jgi:diaminopimelate epimerase
VRAIRFTKMHGLGNDYVYVDCICQSLEGLDLPGLSRAISDRHRGVGSDGLILICPPEPGVEADVRMEMYNADGSRGEMCGNGIRCVARYTIEHGLVRPGGAAPRDAAGEPVGADLRVQTDRGILQLMAFVSGGVVRTVRVDMGSPVLRPREIPVAVEGERCIRQPIEVAGVALMMSCVSMGNPHAVFFVESLERIDLARLGPAVERHPLFPRRVNAHFVAVQSPREATMKTWERGSGVTQACGTGACAVLVAGVLEGRLERAALLHLPGGDLQIEWPDGIGSPVFMTGPAEEVFSGEWPVREGRA